MQKIRLGFIIAIAALIIPVSVSAREFEVPDKPVTPDAPTSNSIIPAVPEIPDADGDYQDPENSKLRVRVIVHKSHKDPLKTNASLSCTDSDSQSDVPATGWKLPSQVTYHLNSSSVPSSVGKVNFETLTSRSYEVWQNAVGGKVGFLKGANTTVNKQRGDGLNILAFNRLTAGALAITYTRYYPDTGLVADVDTIFNTRYAWRWTDTTVNACSLYPNSYDAQDILTHELGHWMGLDDTYDASFVDNTMYGYGDVNEVKKDTLTTGDIIGVTTIYP